MSDQKFAYFICIEMHPIMTVSSTRGARTKNRRKVLYFKIKIGREEIKTSTECTYLGTKIDQTGDNTTEIKHRINQTSKAIIALNSIWWHKNITKKRKLHIYRTIIQSF